VTFVCFRFVHNTISVACLPPHDTDGCCDAITPITNTPTSRLKDNGIHTLTICHGFCLFHACDDQRRLLTTVVHTWMHHGLCASWRGGSLRLHHEGDSRLSSILWAALRDEPTEIGRGGGGPAPIPEPVGGLVIMVAGVYVLYPVNS
jgi:hypothetical protein